MLRKLARWPLTCLLYMLCPNIDTCQWGINSLPFSCTYLLCTPSWTLAIAQTAVKRGHSGFFTFQLSKRRIYRSIQYKYMHVTPDLGEFFAFFLFSRAWLHPLSLQGCCRVTMSAKPSKLSQCEILIFDKKEPGTYRDLPFLCFLSFFLSFS